jgi:hypothetical protein
MLHRASIADALMISTTTLLISLQVSQTRPLSAFDEHAAMSRQPRILKNIAVALAISFLMTRIIIHVLYPSRALNHRVSPGCSREISFETYRAREEHIFRILSEASGIAAECDGRHFIYSTSLRHDERRVMLDMSRH